MNIPVIVDAIRSPMARAKPDGALAEVHPVDLLSQVLEQLVTRNRLDPGAVDDVICGCVSQAGEQAGTPGRLAWLAAGLPAHVPSTTIDRKCGSSQQAVHFAAQAIMAGTQDIVIACGVESMSRVPMGSSRMGKNTTGPRFDARFAPGLVGQGVSADLVAAKWGISRADLDAYAVRSHQRAHAAQSSGGFAREIVGIDTPAGRVEQDETIRAG
ncbi:MAG: thiolase family protein, partial [Burkholderiaceae bacterium]|nr:thiolase family protein [Burkholderiaceae bacterium]